MILGTGRPRTTRSNTNIKLGTRGVTEERTKFTLRQSFQLSIGFHSLQQIVKHGLHMHPYTIRIILACNPEDHLLVLEYKLVFLNMLIQMIIFSKLFGL